MLVRVTVNAPLIWITLTGTSTGTYVSVNVIYAQHISDTFHWKVTTCYRLVCATQQWSCQLVMDLLQINWCNGFELVNCYLLVTSYTCRHTRRCCCSVYLVIVSENSSRLHVHHVLTRSVQLRQRRSLLGTWLASLLTIVVMTTHRCCLVRRHWPTWRQTLTCHWPTWRQTLRRHWPTWSQLMSVLLRYSNGGEMNRQIRGLLSMNTVNKVCTVLYCTVLYCTVSDYCHVLCIASSLTVSCRFISDILLLLCVVSWGVYLLFCGIIATLMSRHSLSLDSDHSVLIAFNQPLDNTTSFLEHLDRHTSKPLALAVCIHSCSNIFVQLFIRQR